MKIAISMVMAIVAAIVASKSAHAGLPGFQVADQIEVAHFHKYKLHKAMRLPVSAIASGTLTYNKTQNTLSVYLRSNAECPQDVMCIQNIRSFYRELNIVSVTSLGNGIRKIVAESEHIPGSGDMISETIELVDYTHADIRALRLIGITAVTFTRTGGFVGVNEVSKMYGGSLEEVLEGIEIPFEPMN